MKAHQEEPLPKSQRLCSARSYSARDENKRLLIHYQSGDKIKVMAAIETSRLPVVYDLTNMNIIVVAVAEELIPKYKDYFQSLDGVLSVQEDSTVRLH